MEASLLYFSNGKRKKILYPVKCGELKEFALPILKSLSNENVLQELTGNEAVREGDYMER
jgi:hypothetical protein